MSGKRGMFKILNTQMNDWAFLTTVLHHTGAVSSRSAAQNWLRIKHFQHLASIDAPQQYCARVD
jgi:hypothetical protein